MTKPLTLFDRWNIDSELEIQHQQQQQHVKNNLDADSKPKKSTKKSTTKSTKT